MRQFLILICLLLASPAWGAVTYDTESHNVAGATTVSQTHVVTGANVVLYCAALYWLNGNGATLTDFTYNSVSMGTAIATDVNTERTVKVYRMVNPPTGSHTWEATFDIATDVVAGCLSLSGVNQATPNGTPVTSNTVATSISDTITIPTNGMGIDFGVVSNDSCPSGLGTKGANQTERFNLCNAGNNVGGFASTNATTGSQAMSWTAFGATSNLAHVAIPINGASGKRPIGAIVFQ